MATTATLKATCGTKYRHPSVAPHSGATTCPPTSPYTRPETINAEGMTVAKATCGTAGSNQRWGQMVDNGCGCAIRVAWHGPAVYNTPAHFDRTPAAYPARKSSAA